MIGDQDAFGTKKDKEGLGGEEKDDLVIECFDANEESNGNANCQFFLHSIFRGN